MQLIEQDLCSKWIIKHVTSRLFTASKEFYNVTCIANELDRLQHGKLKRQVGFDKYGHFNLDSIEIHQNYNQCSLQHHNLMHF